MCNTGYRKIFEGGRLMEEVKQALLTIKKECTKQDDCEGCSISKVLGYSCQEVAIPEEWEIKGGKYE